MPVATVNAGREGYIYNSNSGWPDWPSARNDPNGFAAVNYTIPTSNQTGIQVGYVSGRGGPAYYLNRTYFYFDVAAYQGSITSIDLNVDMAGGGTPLAITAAQSTLAFGGNGMSPLAVGEFDINVPTSPPPKYSGTFTNTSGIVTVTLDPVAVADANASGLLIIQLVEEDFDYNDVDPTPFGFAVYNATLNFGFGTNTLDVTYTAGYGNNVNDIATATLGKINDIGTANISEVNDS